MYSSTGGKSQSGGAPSSAASFRNYDFDFGLGAGFSNQRASCPLRDQKNTSPASSFSSPSSCSRPPFSAAASVTSAPNRPLWTHQPAPSSAAGASSGLRSSLNNPTSMVGDIFGKSWSSTAPSIEGGGGGGNGIPRSDPNLFGDLVGSALGQAKGLGGSNVPLKAAPPRNSYSMGNLSDALPKTTGESNSWKPTSRGSADNLGSYYPSTTANNIVGSTIGGNSLGGQPMRSTGAAAGARTDPFRSLVDIGRKQSADPPPAANSSSTTNGFSGVDYSFGSFQDADRQKTASTETKLDDFGMPPVQDLPSQKPPPASQPKVTVDPLDMLFSFSASSGAAAPVEGSGSHPFEADDWDFGAEIGTQNSGSTTIELEGIPPPPAGVTSSMAKNKGLESQKQGQFADAIKWLSWAVVLLEIKSGDTSAIIEVLSCRASCYKEVGEYKKAVADCSKVLELDSANVTALLQRALLYESTEKYKLGAEDLRAVLKIDPGNRLAKSTVHRLTQMAG